MTPLAVAGLTLGVGLALLCARWWTTRQARLRYRSAIKTLVRYCNGDEGLATRLIMRQTDRDSTLNLAEAAELALQELQRDRR